MHQPIELDPDHLSIETIESIIHEGRQVSIGKVAKENIQKAFMYIQKKVENKIQIYGVNTGFGAFSDKLIDKEKTGLLQENLLRSHACGVGDPFDVKIVKLAMLLRIQNFIHGNSGVSQELVDRLLFMVNNDIIPVVPSKGSVGSSGDLAPLSHIGIALLGEGEVIYQNRTQPTSEVFKIFKLDPLRLTYKEGLALNNGTTFITAVGILALLQAKKVVIAATGAAALTIEACAGRKSAFDEKIHAVRPHLAQGYIAEYIRFLLEGSQLFGIECTDIPGKKVATQDSYSLRCIPQVHGASLHAYFHVLDVFLTEINSVTDNPLIFVEKDEVLSGGNFHGQPLAVTMDYLKIVLSELGNISERRTAKLVDSHHNDGLSSFLVLGQEGLNSGMMIPQYVAASLVSENKVLCHPASVDSIPTSANIEDHVSMGTIAARQALEIGNNVLHIIAIELMTAAQGVDCRRQKFGDFTMGVGTQKIYSRIRAKVEKLDDDRYMAPDINAIVDLIQTDEFYDHLDYKNILHI